MDLIKNFLISHSSTSLSLMSHRLEIPYKTLYPLLESALIDLGSHNYRLIYSISSGFSVILCNEKNRKLLESKLSAKARIFAVQRITEDPCNLYNSELHEREAAIVEEIKNGGLFLPFYSNNGAYDQPRREPSGQTKLKFRAKKKADKLAQDIKVVKELVSEKPPVQVFELEEEEFVRCPVEQKMNFGRIAELQVDDMADIIEAVEFVKKINKVEKMVESEEEEEESVEVKEPQKKEAPRLEIFKKEPQVKEALRKEPVKGLKKVNPVEVLPIKRAYESIIPTGGVNKKSKLMQPSLSSFIKK